MLNVTYVIRHLRYPKNTMSIKTSHTPLMVRTQTSGLINFVFTISSPAIGHVDNGGMVVFGFGLGHLVNDPSSPPKCFVFQKL